MSGAINLSVPLLSKTVFVQDAVENSNFVRANTANFTVVPTTQTANSLYRVKMSDLCFLK